METRLKVAERIAQEASLLALDYFRQLSELEVCEKRPQDVFSEADREVENLIRQRLGDHSHRILLSVKSMAVSSAPATGLLILLMGPVTSCAARHCGGFLLAMCRMASRLWA